ncbi:MAG: acyl-CoA dehydrogenase family protein [bacterium]
MMKAANDGILKAINKTSAEFARKELSQIVEKSGTEYFSSAYRAAVEKAWELDFYQTLLPESVEGSDLGCAALCTILKNICREDASFGTIILTTVTAYETLLAANRKSLLKTVTEGEGSAAEFLLGFPLLFHPAEQKIRVTANEISGDYSLSGSLDYLVLAGFAGKALIPAVAENEAGFAFFLTDLTQPGVTISGPVRGLGISACPVSDVVFEQVPAVQCCEWEEGPVIFDQVSSKLSVAVAAMQTGIMNGSFRDALDYTNKRKQGGRNIIHWSEVKKILSGMAIHIQLAEMLVRQCCISIDTSEHGWEADANAAFIRISEMANDVTTDGIQVMGGVGYMKDFHQERRFRDARHLMSIFGIQQLKILLFLEKHISKTAYYNPLEGSP